MGPVLRAVFGAPGRAMNTCSGLTSAAGDHFGLSRKPTLKGPTKQILTGVHHSFLRA